MRPRFLRMRALVPITARAELLGCLTASSARREHLCQAQWTAAGQALDIPAHPLELACPARLVCRHPALDLPRRRLEPRSRGIRLIVRLVVERDLPAQHRREDLRDL